MFYKESIPNSPILREFIDCFWTIEFPEKESFRAEDIVLPDGGVEWVFTLGDGFMREIIGRNAPPEKITNNTLVGQRSSAIRIQQSQKNKLFVIRFKPYGLSFLKFHGVKELSDCVVDARIIFGDLSDRISDLLYNSKACENIQNKIEELLLQSTVATPLNPLLKAMWSEIIISKGQLVIHDFCKRHHVHKSTLQRLFMEHVGSGPKALANIIRMNHTVAGFYTGESLTRIGFEHGYFDQSHMIRDLKKFTGLTPKTFRKQNYLLPKLVKKVDYTRQNQVGLVELIKL